MRGKEPADPSGRRATSPRRRWTWPAPSLEGDADRVTLLQTLICQRRRHPRCTGRSFSTMRCSSATSTAAHHVAVFVPGVGDGTNLCDDWIPEAMQPLRRRRRLDRRGPVEGLRQPGRPAAAADGHRSSATRTSSTPARDLTAFVGWLASDPDQSLTVVAHSFGSIVTGCRVGRPRPARHRRRRGGEPGHDGGRPAAAPPRAVALLLRAGAGRRHRRAGDLRRLPPPRRPSGAPG